MSEWDWRNDPEMESSSGGLLPKGWYVVRVMKTAIGLSTKKHTPYIEVHFEVLADGDREPRNGTVKTTFYMSAKKRMRKFFDAINPPKFDPDNAESTGMALLGRTCSIEVEHKPYEITLNRGPKAGQTETRMGAEIEFGFYELGSRDKALWPNVPAAQILAGSQAGGGSGGDDPDAWRGHRQGGQSGRAQPGFGGFTPEAAPEDDIDSDIPF